MNQITHPGYAFNNIANGDLASLHFCSELSLAICSAQTEYIPIENFRDIFLQISGLLKDRTIKHLLFDKRALRTFHQPSMEWYFTIWKPSVRELGLISHFKILPDLEWFKTAVAAGRHEILTKFDEELLNGITISYVNNPEEAIDAILQQTQTN